MSEQKIIFGKSSNGSHILIQVTLPDGTTVNSESIDPELTQCSSIDYTEYCKLAQQLEK